MNTNNNNSFFRGFFPSPLVAFTVALALVAVYAALIPYSGILSQVYPQHFPLTVQQGTEVSAVYLAAYYIALIPAGLMLDRMGIHRTIFASTIVLTISMIMFGLAKTFGGFLLARALMGVASSFMFLLAIYMARIFFDRRYFSALIGLVEFVFSIAFAIAPYFTIVLAKVMGWRWQSLSVAVILFLLIICYFASHSYRCQPKLIITNNGSVMEQLRHILKNAWFWYLLVVVGLFNTHFVLYTELYAPSYIGKLYQVNYYESVILNNVSIIGYMLGCLSLGLACRLCQKKTRLFFFSMACSVLIYLCNILFNQWLLTSYFLSQIDYFLLGFFSAYAMLVFALYEELSGKPATATINAALNMLSLIPLAFSPFYTWLFNANHAYERLFIFGCYLLALLLGLVMLLPRKKKCETAC